MKKFERRRHIRYFSNCLQNLPRQYSSADTTRLTLVHFCVQALDILDCLPDADTCGRVEEDVYVCREGIIEWIYGLQTLPALAPPPSCGAGDTALAAPGHVGGGFKGGTYLGPLPASQNIDEARGERSLKGEEQQRHPYDHSHLAMTYVAICTLVTLGDDLSRLNKRAILETIRSLQKEDGSFVAISSNSYDGAASSTAKEAEDDDCDLRFMYLALVVRRLLGATETDAETTRIDVPAATSYLLSCVSYDGSIGLAPGREGHGGSAFCGVASLRLLGALDDVLAREDMRGWRKDFVRWCLMRQRSLPRRKGNEAGGAVLDGRSEGDGDSIAGMQGRPNKLQDTCYSYWVGGALHMLSAAGALDGRALREYVLTCQSPHGGFGKVAGAPPDLLHSFYSLAWLALSRDQGGCEEDGDNRGAAGDGDGDEDEGEARRRVDDALRHLSAVDCALGICAKRTPAFRKAARGRRDEARGRPRPPAE